MISAELPIISTWIGAESLGEEPWLTVHYGFVGLKGHPMSSAATRLLEFVIEPNVRCRWRKCN